MVYQCTKLSKVFHRPFQLWRSKYCELLRCHRSDIADLSGFAGGCVFHGKELRGLTPGLEYIDQTYLASTTRDLIINFNLFDRGRFPEFIYSTMEQKKFVISFSSASVSPKHEGIHRGNRELGDAAMNISKNDIRRCIGSCVQALQRRGIQEILVDPAGDAEAAAEGAFLGAFVYDELKCLTRQTVKPEITCFTDHLLLDPGRAQKICQVTDAWTRGTQLAMAQNLARKWMEMPANLLSPAAFAKQASDILEGVACTIPYQLVTHVHGVDWCHLHHMNGLLAVGSGSHRNVAFLEVSYEGDPGRPNNHVALVGKGVTFDAGGISLKPSAGMEDMRADMGGAAVIVSTIYGLSKLRVPINVRAYIPLCENMPGGKALRPGDVIRMANGLSVQVDNTDAEGRLILADALLMATRRPDLQSSPVLVIDVATLTGAVSVALGDEFTGLFSNSLCRRIPVSDIWSLDSRETASSQTGREDVPSSVGSASPTPSSDGIVEYDEEEVDEDDNEDTVVAPSELGTVKMLTGYGTWNHDSILECLKYCGSIRGDRIWSLPLLQGGLLREQGHLADLVNVLGGSAAKKGGSGTAASFLNFFVPRRVPWIHLDIAGVMKTDPRENCYMRKGMSGRPTRTLIEFLDQLSRL